MSANTGTPHGFDDFHFDLRGYVHLAGVLEPDAVAALNGLIDAHRHGGPGAGADSLFFGSFLLWDQAFRDLLDHDEVFVRLRRWVDDEPRLDRCYGLQMTTETPGLPLHGGAADADDPTAYYHADGRRIESGITAVMWCLTDAGGDLGGWMCVPGTHKSTVPTPTSTDVADLVCVPQVAAGDVLVFTASLAHGTAAWRAPFERRALVMKYAPRHVAWSPGYAAWASELLALLTPAQARLFRPPMHFEPARMGFAECGMQYIDPAYVERDVSGRGLPWS
jgi:hypothetical protein